MKHFIPYERNPYFTGRVRYLAEIDIFFASDLPMPLKIAALIGMPGIGKTEIALEYVYRTLRKYQVIVWLDAQSRHQLAENISRTLNMGRSWRTDAERDQIFEAFRTWLWDHQSSFLLVIDQIGDYSLLNDLLDEDMAGNVLMTHASRNAMDDWKSVIVESFNEQESSLFLLRRAGLLASQNMKDASRAVRQGAAAIHEEVGGHPLALDQAGAYIKETGCSIGEYLARYRENPRTLLEQRGTTSASHPFSAYDVIAAMRQGYAYQTQELLFLYVKNLLNCSDPYPRLPPKLQVSSHLREAASDLSTLVTMRHALIHNFVLVPLNGDKTWGIHPLVRTVMKEVMVYEEEQGRLNRAKDDEYEPLDEKGVVQVFIEARQLKEQLANIPQGTPEWMKIFRALATKVIRLKRAVQPGPRRNQARTQIEKRYGELAYGNEAPLFIASEKELRGYARELVALMQHH